MREPQVAATEDHLQRLETDLVQKLRPWQGERDIRGPFEARMLLKEIVTHAATAEQLQADLSRFLAKYPLRIDEPFQGKTVLIHCIQRQYPLVEWLLEHGASLVFNLFVATSGHHHGAFTVLLDKMDDPSKAYMEDWFVWGDLPKLRNSTGVLSVLQRAMFSGQPFFVQALLDRGISPLQGDLENLVPLHYAAMSNAYSTALQALQRGIPITRDRCGLTPLDYARKHEHPDLVQLLEPYERDHPPAPLPVIPDIQFPPDVDRFSDQITQIFAVSDSSRDTLFTYGFRKFGGTPHLNPYICAIMEHPRFDAYFHYLCCVQWDEPHHQRARDYLVEWDRVKPHFLFINYTELNERTAKGHYNFLIYSLISNNETYAQFLLRQGIETWIQDAYGDSPAFYAAAVGNVTLFQQLLSNNVLTLYTQDIYGQTGWHYIEALAKQALPNSDTPYRSTKHQAILEYAQQRDRWFRRFTRFLHMHLDQLLHQIPAENQELQDYVRRLALFEQGFADAKELVKEYHHMVEQLIGVIDPRSVTDEVRESLGKLGFDVGALKSSNEEPSTFRIEHSQMNAFLQEVFPPEVYADGEVVRVINFLTEHDLYYRNAPRWDQRDTSRYPSSRDLYQFILNEYMDFSPITHASFRNYNQTQYLPKAQQEALIKQGRMVDRDLVGLIKTRNFLIRHPETDNPRDLDSSCRDIWWKIRQRHPQRLLIKTNT